MKNFETALKHELTTSANEYINYLERAFHNFNSKIICNSNTNGSTVRMFEFGGVTTKHGTYVESVGNKNVITLSIEDTVNYATVNNISIEAATKYLLSHEVFHVLLGHFSAKYKNHDRKLLNIAGDLEINSYLGIEHPAIVAEDYGFDRYLSTDIYYEKLLALKQVNQLSQNGNGTDGADGDPSDMAGNSENPSADSSQNSNQSSTPNNMDSANDDRTNQSQSSNGRSTSTRRAETKAEHEARLKKEIEDSLGVKLPDNVIINQTSSEMLEDSNTFIEPVNNPANYNLSEMNELLKLAKKNAKVTKMSYDKYNLAGLDEIMKNLIRCEKDKTIVPHTKQSTYYKLNNRRTSDFILPGKKLLGGGTTKKFADSLTVFIDTSGSTNGKINRDLMAVAYRLHKENATIVYYTDRIELIVAPTDPFITMSDGGGTSIVNTIHEYKQNHKLERAYVFTDGEDSFMHMDKVTSKYSVFFVKNSTVYERYNNNNPQKARN